MPQAGTDLRLHGVAAEPFLQGGGQSGEHGIAQVGVFLGDALQCVGVEHEGGIGFGEVLRRAGGCIGRDAGGGAVEHRHPVFLDPAVQDQEEHVMPDLVKKDLFEQRPAVEVMEGDFAAALEVFAVTVAVSAIRAQQMQVAGQGLVADFAQLLQMKGRQPVDGVDHFLCGHQVLRVKAGDQQAQSGRLAPDVCGLKSFGELAGHGRRSVAGAKKSGGLSYQGKSKCLTRVSAESGISHTDPVYFKGLLR